MENLLPGGVKVSNGIGGNRRLSRGLGKAKLSDETIFDTNDFALGFSLLGPYMKELERRNPGCIVKIEHTETSNGEKVFKRLFVQLEPMVRVRVKGHSKFAKNRCI